MYRARSQSRRNHPNCQGKTYTRRVLFSCRLSQRCSANQKGGRGISDHYKCLMCGWLLTGITLPGQSIKTASTMNSPSINLHSEGQVDGSVGKVLAAQHEVMGSDPQHPHKKTGMLLNIWNSSVKKVVTLTPRAHWLGSLANR